MQKRLKRLRLPLKVKVIAIMLLFTVLLSAGTVIISYSTYTRSFNEHYEKLATSISKTSSDVINFAEASRLTNEVSKTYHKFCEENGGVPELDSFSEYELREYYSNFAYIKEMPEYRSLLELLQKIRADNDVVSLYIGYTDIDTMRDLYIVDASEEGEACQPGDFDVVEQEHIDKVLKGDYTFPAYVTNYEEYGWLCSASAPVTDENGKVVCMVLVDISMNKILSDRQAFLFQIAVIIAIAAAVMLILTLIITDRAIIKPIDMLSTAANNYIKNKKENDNTETSVFEPLKIKTGDEIENLHTSLKQMESDISSYIKEVTVINAEKERIGAELDVATHIQKSMLPCIFPAFPDRKEFDIYATMNPAKEVGGDFYDFFMVDERHLAVFQAEAALHVTVLSQPCFPFSQLEFPALYSLHRATTIPIAQKR